MELKLNCLKHHQTKAHIYRGHIFLLLDVFLLINSLDNLNINLQHPDLYVLV